MTEEHQHTNDTAKGKPSLFDRLASVFSHEPSNRDELLTVLRNAQHHQLFDAEALVMMEGALKVAELSAADLMVPRAQMEVVDITEPQEVWLNKLIARGHSRFPVVDGDIDEVLGILHAKDLLRLIIDKNYDLRKHLRTPRFIPETQPLNVLLRDFRATRNHLALVIDEFGSVSGLITIEDVIEQVIGEIDDEFDNVNAGKDNVTAVDQENWRVKAETPLEQFNEFFGSNLTDDYCETVGGVVTDRFEHVPHRGESIEIDGFRFKVIKGDERQAHLFMVERLKSTVQDEATEG